MSAPSRAVNLKLFKRLLTEIRHNHGKETWRSSPMTAYVSEQFRSHQVTSEKVCRAEPEMRHLAMTYKCYLENIRKNEELTAMYKGKGERSTEEAAALVGLNLPKNPLLDT